MDGTALVVSLSSLAGMALFVAVVVAYNRRLERTCPKCKLSMPMVPEHLDYVHLNPGQIVEEAIGAVDYQVHICPTCEHTRTFRVDTWLSNYTKCPRCASRTRTTNRKILEHPTESTPGLAEITENCRHCDYRYYYTQRIPTIEDGDMDLI